VLLARGARRVYAVDVGREQLHPKLRQRPQIVSIEQTDIRELKNHQWPELPDFVCIDVSFISLKLVLPAAFALAARPAHVLALVKPQFEAGRAQVGKHGLVTDPAVHEAVIARVTADAAACGLTRIALTPSPITGATGNREYLLLIEDEPDVADLASEMLAEEGYRVVIAHDGFEALKIYEKMGKQIGLVILDYFLPVIDGDAVFEELRSINPKVNVVLSSGFAEQTKIASMLAQGLRGFIPKPYSREKLLEQVRSTLDAARQPNR